ncbi:MAG: DUF4340 domain-containing protein [Myxococcota bacterium]|nr:DUF4340 domain-containing protein [Myxococcota bacterium]
MKAFRGSLIAVALLGLVAAVVVQLKPSVLQPGLVEGDTIFSFEKHELVKVEVTRAEGAPVVLVETDGQWIIEGTGHPAGRSMVNRVKHQIHDLTARASVVDAPDTPALYGLGPNAVRVTLTLRDGETIGFSVGDPNPTAVSYYIQPDGSSAIYTVQKAAVDYYSLTLDEFRERRFATFDTKDVTGLTARLEPSGGVLELERAGARQWDMKAPLSMAANDDQVRRLLGRISALKAIRFEERASVDLASYGFDRPRLDVAIRFASRPAMRVQVGGQAPAESRFDELAYVLLDDDDTVYVARAGLLEEFARDPASMRNRRVVAMSHDDVVSIDATLAPVADDPLSGEGSVRYVAAQWVWKDGVPVSGSTPKRAAQRLAELEVDEFVPPGKSSTAHGLANPRARVVLKDADERERVVVFGAAGPAKTVGDEGDRVDRFYAQIEGEEAVYLVNTGALEVVRDLVRESGRKDKRDAEKASRRERIESGVELESGQ